MNKVLAKLGAEITRIQKGKKEQNGYVERRHRTDDEEFYIPFGSEIKNTDSLFDYAYGWLRYYNTKRPYYGRELDGQTPLEYLKTIMPEIDSRIVLMPPLFLDRITSHPTGRVDTICVDITTLFSNLSPYEISKIYLY